MAIIGSFICTDEEYTGRIRTFTLDLNVLLTPVESPSERAPDYRMIVAGVEVGAGWKRAARDSGRAYIAIKFDDPSFASPIYASLVASDESDIFHLIWSRPNAS